MTVPNRPVSDASRARATEDSAVALVLNGFPGSEVVDSLEPNDDDVVLEAFYPRDAPPWREHDDECLPRGALPAGAPESRRWPEALMRARLTGAGTFVFVDTESSQPIHGRGDQVLHASGEATFIVAVSGAGKSTYGQNFALRRTGLIAPTEFVGLPVRELPEGEAVLYVAADRPRQIQRSLRRMVTEPQLQRIDKRIKVWRGPLPFLLNREPLLLLEFILALEERASVVLRDVVLDSLKDVALEIAKDEGGSAVAQSINNVVAEGREVLVLHHERKPPSGAKRVPADLSDVYGSTFLTACAGNVVYLHGPSGAHIVQLRHLKQSADEVGPLSLVHDHDTGEISVLTKPDLLELVRKAPIGVTVKEAARYLWPEEDEPSPNTVEKARRQLRKLVDGGLITEIAARDGFAGASRWVAVAGRFEGLE